MSTLCYTKYYCMYVLSYHFAVLDILIGKLISMLQINCWSLVRKGFKHKSTLA